MLYYIGPISSTFLTNIFSGTKSNIMMKLIGEVGNSDEMVITNSGGTIARRSQQDQFDIAHKGYNWKNLKTPKKPKNLNDPINLKNLK